MAKSTKKRDDELASLLEEVRTLKEDIEVLRRNPIIGEAVSAALAHARDAARANPDHLPPTYQVAVRTRPDRDAVVLPDSAVHNLPPNYAVAARTRPDREAVVLPATRTRAAKSRPAAKKPAPAPAAGRKKAKARKGK